MLVIVGTIFLGEHSAMAMRGGEKHKMSTDSSIQRFNHKRAGGNLFGQLAARQLEKK